MKIEAKNQYTILLLIQPGIYFQTETLPNDEVVFNSGKCLRRFLFAGLRFNEERVYIKR